MKRLIHINQHVIRKNAKEGRNDPPITVKEAGGRNRYCREIKILGPSQVVYRPEDRLSCGASVWVETEAEIEMVDETTYAAICAR